jgi:hypothetical protein
MKKIVFLLLIGNFLFSCDGQTQKTNQPNKSDQSAALLEEVKSYYLQNIPDKDKQICFYLGDISFPYQSKTLTYPAQSRAKVWVNNELHRRLDLFTQLNLITKQMPNDDNGSATYTLTEAGQSYFRDDKFCAGQIEFTHLDIPVTKSASIVASVSYKAINLPSWITSEPFIDYFYRYNKEDSDIIYPDFQKNKINSFPVDISKLRNGTYFLNHKNKILAFINKSYHPKTTLPLQAEQSYAYYDESFVERFVKYSWSWSGEYRGTKVYWGDPDPIIIAPILVSPKVAKINNLLLLSDRYELLYYNQKLMKTAVVNTDGENDLISNSIKLNFSEDGCLDRYRESYKNKSNISEIAIYNKKNLQTENVTWTYERKLLNPHNYFGYWDVMTARYNEANSGYFTIYTNGEHLIPSSNDVEYDQQQRLIKINDKTISYDKNNNIIQISDEESVFQFSYDKNNQLIQSINYFKNNKSAKKEICTFNQHNAYGDWTEVTCDGLKMKREITYYE